MTITASATPRDAYDIIVSCCSSCEGIPDAWKVRACRVCWSLFPTGVCRAQSLQFSAIGRNRNRSPNAYPYLYLYLHPYSCSPSRLLSISIAASISTSWSVLVLYLQHAHVDTRIHVHIRIHIHIHIHILIPNPSYYSRISVYPSAQAATHLICLNITVSPPRTLFVFVPVFVVHPSFFRFRFGRFFVSRFFSPMFSFYFFLLLL